MNFFNNLFTFVAATTNTAADESQLLWFILAGGLLIILIAVIIAVASTSAASAAIAQEEGKSLDDVMDEGLFTALLGGVAGATMYVREFKTWNIALTPRQVTQI